MYILLGSALIVLGVIWLSVVCTECRQQKSWDIDHGTCHVSPLAGDGFYSQPCFIAESWYKEKPVPEDQCRKRGLTCAQTF